MDLQGLATHCFQQMVVIQNQEESMTEARKKLKRKAQQIRRVERQVVSKKTKFKTWYMVPLSLWKLFEPDED